MVPDMVKQFVSYFYRHIRERNINEIWSMYDVSFNKLSERYFKTLPWPPAEAISRLVDDDHVFCLLYREMYYRHLYQRLMPSLEDRMGSWDNYCQLFQIILEAPINMQLPNGWLWDMVDEVRGVLNRAREQCYAKCSKCSAMTVALKASKVLFAVLLPVPPFLSQPSPVSTSSVLSIFGAT